MAKVTRNDKVKFSVYANKDVKDFLDSMAAEEERPLAFITSRALRFYKDAMEGKIDTITVQKTTISHTTEALELKNTTNVEDPRDRNEEKIESTINEIKGTQGDDAEWID